MKYKGYEAVIRYSEEDETFVGEVINTNDLLVFDGNSMAEIEQSFHAVVDQYLIDCERDRHSPDKPFSGRFVARMEPDLHRALVLHARRLGMRVNTFVNQQLRMAIQE